MHSCTYVYRTHNKEKHIAHSYNILIYHVQSPNVYIQSLTDIDNSNSGTIHTYPKQECIGKRICAPMNRCMPVAWSEHKISAATYLQRHKISSRPSMVPSMYRPFTNQLTGQDVIVNYNFRLAYTRTSQLYRTAMICVFSK